MGRCYFLVKIPNQEVSMTISVSLGWFNTRPENGWASMVAQMVKNLPAIQETWLWSLGWEDPLEEEMITHFSILTWTIPMDRGACQATVQGLQRVGHD